MMSPSSRHSIPCALLGDQQHLSNILAVLDEMMGDCSLVEWKGPRDLRLDRALLPQAHQLVEPPAHAVDLAPHVTEVDAENALVGAHEGEGIELKPGCAREH